MSIIGMPNSLVNIITTANNKLNATNQGKAFYSFVYTPVNLKSSSYLFPLQSLLPPALHAQNLEDKIIFYYKQAEEKNKGVACDIIENTAPSLVFFLIFVKCFRAVPLWNICRRVFLSWSTADNLKIAKVSTLITLAIIDCLRRVLIHVS